MQGIDKEKKKMFVTEKGLIFNNLSPSLFVKKNGRQFGTIVAKRRDSPENSKTQEQFNFPLRVSSTILARSAVAVFGLGFIDAGYSGDWSRIGVISKESEDLLKNAGQGTYEVDFSSHPEKYMLITAGGARNGAADIFALALMSFEF